MKQLIAIFSLALLTGCATAYLPNYRLGYTMIEPIQTESMRFEDSVLAIHFSVNENNIRFIMTNKINTPLKLIWDDAAIAVGNSSEKVLRPGMRYIDAGKSQPPSTIPGRSSYREEITPAGNVYFHSAASNFDVSEWKKVPILPNSDYALHAAKLTPDDLKGQIIKVVLPFQLDGKEKFYTFAFKVSEVGKRNSNGSYTSL